MTDASGFAEQLARVLAVPGSRGEQARRAAALIRAAGGYRWVGLYDVTASEIRVLAWDGPAPPAHPRFARSQGLNGAAVASGAPVLVPDVAADPRYLPTLGETRAELIVPVLTAAAEPVGTIDVESAAADAFDAADVRLLQAAAAVLLPLWAERRPSSAR